MGPRFSFNVGVKNGSAPARIYFLVIKIIKNKDLIKKISILDRLAWIEFETLFQVLGSSFKFGLILLFLKS
jgi:hypothetical protein